MDLATIVGFVAGLVILMTVMILDGGSPVELISHPAAILLIVGGSLAATTISSPLREVLKLPKLIVLAITQNRFEPLEVIELITRMADKARREGLLALEDEAKKIKEPFLQKGIMMVVDGVDPHQVREILESSIRHMESRHKAGAGLFAAAGGFSPTFGIIGTVMGLISVLKQLDDPNKLAKSIASAFLATLWGLLMANLIYLPIASKLKARSEEEVQYRHMIMEGILAIQAGENPRIVREKLLAYLPPKYAASAEKQSEKQGATKSTETKKARAEA
jgi:chemotaxis protein MotA